MFNFSNQSTTPSYGQQPNNTTSIFGNPSPNPQPFVGTTTNLFGQPNNQLSGALGLGNTNAPAPAISTFSGMSHAQPFNAQPSGGIFGSQAMTSPFAPVSNPQQSGSFNLLGGTNPSSSIIGGAPQSNNLFGGGSTSTGSIFGQPQPQPQPQAQTSIFGGIASTTVPNFGQAPSNSIFSSGSNTTGGSIFNNNNTNNAFGSAQAAPVFNQQATSNNSFNAFGASAPSVFGGSNMNMQMQQQNLDVATYGSQVLRFTNLQAEEPDNSNSSKKNIIYYNSLTSQPCYADYSFEELRRIDLANKKKGIVYSGNQNQTGGMQTGFNNSVSGTGSLFGQTNPQNTFQTNTTTNNGFGFMNQQSGMNQNPVPSTQTSSSLFGGMNTGIGSNSNSLFIKPNNTNLFGNNAQTQQAGQGTSLFGNTVPNPTSNTGSLFGNSNTNATPTFGGFMNQNKPATTSLFGNNAIGGSNAGTSNTGMFMQNTNTGTTGTTGNFLGSSAPSTSLFGGMGGSTTTTTSTSLFDNKNGFMGMGTNNQPSLFGQSSNTQGSTSLFGQNRQMGQTTAPQTSLFGQTNQQSGGILGSSMQQSSNNQGLFGSTSTNNQANTLFGNNTTGSGNAPTASLFGNQTTNNQYQGNPQASQFNQIAESFLREAGNSSKANSINDDLLNNLLKSFEDQISDKLADKNISAQETYSSSQYKYPFEYSDRYNSTFYSNRQSTPDLNRSYRLSQPVKSFFSERAYNIESRETATGEVFLQSKRNVFMGSVLSKLRSTTDSATNNAQLSKLNSYSREYSGEGQLELSTNFEDKLKVNAEQPKDLKISVMLSDYDIIFEITCSKKATVNDLKSSIISQSKSIDSLKKLNFTLTHDNFVVVKKYIILRENNLLSELNFVNGDFVQVLVKISEQKISKPEEVQSKSLLDACTNKSILNGKEITKDETEPALPPLKDIPTIKKLRSEPSYKEICRFTAAELANVQNFKIFNEHGAIKFLEPVDLTGLNIDEIASIEKYSVSLYKNKEKPSSGKELNKKAEIEIYNLEANGEEEEFEDYLKDVCKSKNAEFQSFKDGKWRFKLSSF